MKQDVGIRLQGLHIVQHFLSTKDIHRALIKEMEPVKGLAPNLAENHVLCVMVALVVVILEEIPLAKP